MGKRLSGNVVECSDGAEMQVELPVGEQIETDFVQLTGTLSVDGNVLKCLRIQNVGPTFDMANYNTLVTLTHDDKAKALF
jgi:hypothetical protein